MRNICMFISVILVMVLGCFPVAYAEWQTELVDSAGDVGRSSCIVLGSDGYPHISYYKNDTKDLKYARKTVSGWDPLTLDVSGDVGLISSMCLRAGQYPYIAYIDLNTNVLKMAYFEESDWHIETLPADYDAQIGPTLTLNPQGYPYIAYISADANSRLRILYDGAGGWVDRDVEWHIDDQDIVIDLSSYVQMVYTMHPTGESTRIRWAGMYGETASFETVLDSGRYIVGVEFYWNPDDYVSHLIFCDTTQPSLYYGKKESTNWEFEVIDLIYPAPNPALAVDSAGYPHVLYGAALDEILKYAWQDATGWHIETVPISGATGTYHSMVLDDQNMAHSSTYDSINKDLIYAKRFVPVPTSTPPPQPTPTPTSDCSTLGVHLYMPSVLYLPGDTCGCDLYICNPDAVTYAGTPVFVILDILGTYFFAPDFSSFNHYTQDVGPGMTKLVVLPVFQWPTGAGSFEGAKWYAAMTDTAITGLFGQMDMMEFGWTE